MLDALKRLYFDLFFTKNPDMFSRVSKIFHWTMAVIILLMISSGFFMTKMGFSPTKLEIYALHKSFGILVLMLVAFRLIARYTKPPPKPLETHSKAEKVLSKSAHYALYALMILMPLSGWIMSSAGDFPNSFFGLFEMPDLVSKDEGIFNFFRETHELLAIVILIIVGAHMAGAFKHEYIDGDQTLSRMTKKNLSMVSVVYLTVLFVALWLGPFVIMSQKDPGKAARIVERIVQSESKTIAAENLDDAWTIIKDESRVRFSATQYGSAFEGEFKAFDGQIVFDAEDLENARVNITFDLSSIETGSDDRDQQALDKDWFYVEKFPTAAFVASGFEQTGANRYIVSGNLTIREHTQPLSFPFTLDIVEKDNSTKRAIMNASFSLNRLDFGVGQGQWQDGEAIGKTVEITVTTVAEQSIGR